MKLHQYVFIAFLDPFSVFKAFIGHNFQMIFKEWKNLTSNIYITAILGKHLYLTRNPRKVVSVLMDILGTPRCTDFKFTSTILNFIYYLFIIHCHEHCV